MHWLGLVAVVVGLVTLRRVLRGPLVWFGFGLAFVVLIYPLYEHAWFGETLSEPSERPGADAAMMFASA